jgi:hypothetical protein
MIAHEILVHDAIAVDEDVVIGLGLADRLVEDLGLAVAEVLLPGVDDRERGAFCTLSRITAGWVPVNGRSPTMRL